jgi:hypothetical protein
MDARDQRHRQQFHEAKIFVVEPKSVVFPQHLLRRFQISTAHHHLGQPLVFNLGDVGRMFQAATSVDVPMDVASASISFGRVYI